MNDIKNADRIFYLDVLRIIAILAIILLHTSCLFVEQFFPNTTEYITGNIFDSLSRIGVPFFVMISGALMLNQDKDLTVNKVKNKVIKLLLLFAGWSLFYVLYSKIFFPYVLLHIPISINLKQMFLNFICGHFHLWYLYMAIGLYLLVPVLRLFVKKENNKYIYYIIVLSLVFQFLPEMFIKNIQVFEYFKQFYMDFVKGYWIFFILGWVLCVDNPDFINKYKKQIYAVGLISLVSMILSRYFFYDLKFEPELIIFTFLYAASAFLFIKNLVIKFESKMHEKVKLFLCKASKLSLGIYLIHIVVIDIVRFYMGEFFNLTLKSGNCLLYIFVVYTITVFFSYLITALISKNKLLNKCISI